VYVRGMTNVSDSASPAPAQPIPAGWYPDYTGAPRLRWWDGSAWTDHVSEPTAANETTAAPRPAVAPTQTVPAGTPTGNVFIWLIVLLPIVLIVLRSTLDYGQLGVEILDESRRGASGVFGPANGLSVALSGVSLLLAGVTVLLAYFDVRRLRATGFERPFPWPWAFFTLISGVGVLVYVIGRTVVVRRRSGRGLAPLFVAIAIALLGIVLGAVHNAQLMGPIFDEFGTGDIFDSGSLDS